MRIITLLIAFMFVSDPTSEQFIIRQQVGWIELNQVINPVTGKQRLSQVIFWDIDPVTGRNECRGWLPTEKVVVVGARVIVLQTQPVFLIEGAFIQQTRTFHDPEIENRKIIPLQQRRLVANAR